MSSIAIAVEPKGFEALRDRLNQIEARIPRAIAQGLNEGRRPRPDPGAAGVAATGRPCPLQVRHLAREHHAGVRCRRAPIRHRPGRTHRCFRRGGPGLHHRGARQAGDTDRGVCLRRQDRARRLRLGEDVGRDPHFPAVVSETRDRRTEGACERVSAPRGFRSAASTVPTSPRSLARASCPAGSTRPRPSSCRRRSSSICRRSCDHALDPEAMCTTHAGEGCGRPVHGSFPGGRSTARPPQSEYPPVGRLRNSIHDSAR